MILWRNFMKLSIGLLVCFMICTMLIQQDYLSSVYNGSLMFSNDSTDLYEYYNDADNEKNNADDQDEEFSEKNYFIQRLKRHEYAKCLRFTNDKSDNDNVNDNDRRYRWRLKPDTCDNSTRIVLLIKSSVYQNTMRWNLRKTWAQDTDLARYKTKRVFLMGSPANQSEIPFFVREEAKLYNDILLGRFNDEYRRTTSKVLMGVKFVIKHCRHAELTIIADDDVLIVPWNYFSLFDNVGKLKDELFFGGFYTHGVPYRDNSSKWYVSESEYSCQTYPPYVAGAAMAASMTVLTGFYALSQHFEPFFLDDVLFGVLADFLKIDLTYFPVERWLTICSNAFKSHGEISARNAAHLAVCHDVNSPSELQFLWSEVCSRAIVDADTVDLVKAYCYELIQ